MSSLLLRRLPFPAVLALRYLRSTRRDAFASFLSAVAAGGLALGVMALILSLAVISGFQTALRGELLGRTPQIEVELPPDAGADVAEAARQAVLKVEGWRRPRSRCAAAAGWCARGRCSRSRWWASTAASPARSRAPRGDPRGSTSPRRSRAAGG